MIESAAIRFEWEWESADHMRSPELAATFARLKIFVGDRCVTLVEDRDSGSSRRAIAVSLYPLAEWIAFNWWFLRADSRNSRSLARGGDWPPSPHTVRSDLRKARQRHGMRGAGDGFRWPDLRILPEGAGTLIQWRADEAFPPGSPIRFLTSGEALVDPPRLGLDLAGLVDAVIRRLQDCGVEKAALFDEWSAVRDAAPDEADFCLAAARLGLDPYSETASFESEIVRAADALPPVLLADFLNIVDPDHIDADLEWIVAAQSRFDELSDQPCSPPPTVDPDFEAFTVTDVRFPWRAGWRIARKFREELGIEPQAVFPLEQFVRYLVLDGPDAGLQALGTADDSATNVVLGRQQHPLAQRFTLGRAMWRALSNPGHQFLVTSGHSLQQRVERAFAAELLAPAEGIARIVGGNPQSISEDDIEKAQEHFQVSSLAVKHQIDNQLLSTWH